LKIEYKIIENQQILIQKFIGVFCMDAYKASAMEVIKKPEWKFVNKILIDLREAEVGSVMSHLSELIDFRKNVLKKNYHSVSIVNKPKHTVAVHLYKESLSEYNYHYCSTVKKALSLLGMSDNKEVKQVLTDWIA